MDLSTSTVLFLDCQTTGMRPPTGALLEIGWGWGRAVDEALISAQSHLVRLPEGTSIPFSVSQLTGISESHLQGAKELIDLHGLLMEDFARRNQHSVAVIHYAQFEKPFLQDFFFQTAGDSQLPFEILCSQILSKKLFPNLPSRNIRGLSGYFGSRTAEIRRASSHVQATFEIWKGLVQELNTRGVHTLQELKDWLAKPEAREKIRYEYRIAKEKRLGLPAKPGIYRMKAKSGEILYVGKATSLKDRVNSYFRGRKGRDPKKLEMLAQVWDLDFIETETALEAALLENDEIKRWDPPYNINLKVRARELLFYSATFKSSSPFQDEIHCIGPFRPAGPLEQLRLLSQSLEHGSLAPVFYQPIPMELLDEGYQIFCERHRLSRDLPISLRSALAFGFKLYRQEIRSRKENALAEDGDFSDGGESETSNSAEVELNAEEVSRKFERLFLRSAQSLHRARWMTKLLNSHIEWESEIGWKSLDFHSGKIQLLRPTEDIPWPWEKLTIADYDRMSILLSEIAKHPHRIITF